MLNLLRSSKPSNGSELAPVGSKHKQPAWLGIDFGVQSAKLVQLSIHAGLPVIQSSWCIPLASVPIDADPASLQIAIQEQVATIPALRRLFMGKQCAASLPMSVSQLRWLDLPKVSDHEQGSLVCEELLAELESDGTDLSIGHWSTGKSFNSDALLSRFAGYAVPRALAESIGKKLLRVGLHCQAIDAIPCALARAVQLMGYRRSEDTVLAIDLSHKLPLVVLVVRGVPLFVRPLRDAGMATLLDPLCQEFGITSLECQQLLSRFGIPAPDQPATPVALKAMQVIHHPVNHLVNEIKRTVDFVKQQFTATKPTQVCLFGGGAMIKNLPAKLSHALQLPVLTWTLCKDSANPRDAIFGLAAGLSALAWEIR